MKILDLFCSAGGVSQGIKKVFPNADIIGVDIKYQKNYPYEFILYDALKFPLTGFDFIWASPPCQGYSKLTPKQYKTNHKNLIPDIRQRLNKIDIPYIIENVYDAKKEMINPLMLCGSMFNKNFHRHRLFESPYLHFNLLPKCSIQNKKILLLVYGSCTNKNNVFIRKPKALKFNICNEFEIYNMTNKELRQTIPICYTEYLINNIFNND